MPATSPIVLEYSGPDTNGVATVIPVSALSSAVGTAGTLSVGNNSALGSGPVVLSNGVLNAVSNVAFTNPFSFSGGPLPVILTGSAINFNSPSSLTGNTALSVNNTTTFNSDLAGTSSLSLTNQPVVAGANTFTGAAGNLVVAAPLSLSGSVTVGAGTLTLNGNGDLPNIAATTATQTISMTKVASGNFTLTYNGLTTAAITYSTTPATTAAAILAALQAAPVNLANVNVTALGTSGANNQYFTVTFTGPLANTPQPLMTITNSALVASANVVRLSVAQATIGSAALTINTGGTVTEDNTGTNVVNRINTTATVALGGGSLNVLGSSTAASSQTFGCSHDGGQRQLHPHDDQRHRTERRADVCQLYTHRRRHRQLRGRSGPDPRHGQQPDRLHEHTDANQLRPYWRDDDRCNLDRWREHQRLQPGQLRGQWRHRLDDLRDPAHVGQLVHRQLHCHILDCPQQGEAVNSLLIIGSSDHRQRFRSDGGYRHGGRQR